MCAARSSPRSSATAKSDASRHAAHGPTIPCRRTRRPGDTSFRGRCRAHLYPWPQYVDGPGGVRARGRVSLPSGAAQTSAADAMMIKCDDIVRASAVLQACVQSNLYKLACFAPVSPAVSINTTRCRFFLVCADCF